MLRLVTWLLVACITGVIFALDGSGPSVVVFAVIIVVPAVAIGGALFAAPKVTADLHVPSALKKGVKSEAWLEVTNPSIVPLARVSIALKIENLLTRESDVLDIECAVAPKSTTRVTFDFISEHAGRFVFSGIKTRVFDVFGLRGWASDVLLNEKRTVPCVTFPMTIGLSGSENFLGDSEIQNLNRRGSDYSEPFQIRNYAEGDSLKQIHWKLSQKFDTFLVNDPSVARERSLLVVWDKSSSPSPAVTDALAEAILSFSLQLVDDDVPFSLFVGGGNGDAIRDISDLDDVFDAMHELFIADAETEALSTLFQALGGRRFPLIACFAAKIPHQLQELGALGNTTVFLCDHVSTSSNTSNVDINQFSTSDYQTVLREVRV